MHPSAIDRRHPASLAQRIGHRLVPVSFRCYGGRIWPRYLASIVKPDMALTVKRE